MPIVERLTQDFDHAFSELAQIFAGERRRVVIRRAAVVAAGALPRVIASFQRTHPQVEIIVRDSLSGTLYQQMQERQVDLAVTTPPNSVDFHFAPLFDDPGDDRCRPAARSTCPSCNLDDVRDHPFIAMAPRSSVRELTDAAMSKADVAVRRCTNARSSPPSAR